MSAQAKLPSIKENGAPLFSQHQIVERRDTKVGQRLVCRGVFSAVDIPNDNKRLYPERVWDLQLAEGSPLMNRLGSRLALGELEHPDSGLTHLARVSHVNLKVWKEDLQDANQYKVPKGRYLLGEYMILHTPNGMVLEELHACGIPVGMSSRGRGDMVPNENGIDVVQENYECETWDCVYSPSVRGAYPMPVKDSKDDAIADPVQETETVLAECQAVDVKEPLALVEAGARAARLSQSLSERKDAKGQEALQKVNEARKRLLGHLLDARRKGPALQKAGHKKKERTAVSESKRVAALMAAMAKRVVLAEAKDSESQDKKKRSAPFARVKSEEDVAPDIQKRLRLTTQISDRMIALARKEREGRIRSDRRYESIKILTNSLINRGRKLTRQLSIMSNEEQRRSPDALARMRPGRAVAESTAATGVRDPAEGRQPEKVSESRESSSLIRGLADQGL